MIRYLSAALLAGMTLSPHSAWSDAIISLRDSGKPLFSVTMPDFWTLKSGGERLLTLPGTDDARPVPQILSMHPSEDPSIWMGFFSPKGVRTIDEGRTYLREASNFLANDPKIIETPMQTIGGRSAQVIKGTGRRDGKNIQFSIAVIHLPNNRIAIGASVVEQGTDPSFYREINAVYDSFRVGQ